MSSTAPNMGLKYNWDLGTYFKAEMDANLKKLDRFYMPVLSATIGTPPGSPNNGDRYIIPNTGATGAWVGNETKIATRVAGAWEYDVPVDGMRLRDLETDEMLTYDSAAGGSSDGAWVSDYLSILKSNVRGIALINMSNADYVMSDAEAKNFMLAVLSAGDGTKTITVPSTSDGKTPGSYLLINIYANAGYYLKSETYGSTGGFIDSRYGELAAYSTILNPTGILGFAGQIHTLGTGPVHFNCGGDWTLGRAQRGYLHIGNVPGPHVVTIPLRDAASQNNEYEQYFFIADYSGWTFVPENTTMSVIFHGTNEFEVGVRYTICRDGYTNNWRVFKG